ncbi:MAG: hypothetical protein A2700_03030 [Candidatus Blackburnbacteria bacterium RIFCSPHIGHO2_01_FULL_44_64]|uniref:8-oxo-dGTP diphosphatase n=2 Tax=Patescibacteria group TaxID=1783273 RepID=A0A0G1ND78_9BACT|nr:MAG: NUDIX hydrolase [Candidatus Azambacteria bacterium GW2011_GWA1_44_9]OGY08308.1 MAG: hypothetical protein A2700_03030 [Candidatus Blackburnbacteria bacterium RIFCSPHIGHO2_01_FULL_44_64]OGY10381.1 MAG: hypothetical protein A3D26_03665 [Candidatus Blackburnbacteria bacterium RIFCSPHIGHO2_02_FULL_44_20]OGY12108.1 MAG: hypothetical protein A3E16_00115 [Candidatus Blackburnbacteria bacterium RIFCSPHIGHO2_12_FULL_44_25]OGY13725.1 MAG: hypothetical protein A3A62_02840 [Candidatus Blackburnbacte
MPSKTTKKPAIAHFKDFIVLVTGVIIKPRNEILVVRRSTSSKTFPDFWQLPEGKIEFGEQPLETFKREITEELGCKPSRPKIVHALSLIYPFAGKKFHLLRIIITSKLIGKITLSSEHNEYKWIKLKDLGRIKNLVPGTKELVKSLPAIP